MTHSVAWGRVFYAPRWVWSRAQLIVGQPLWKGDSASRKAVAKVYVRAAIGIATFQILKHFLYSLLAGDDDEHKPKYEIDLRSSGFGKTRLGETRLDSGAGVNQIVTLAARIITGKTKRANGELVPIRGDDMPWGGDDARNIIHRFLDTKLAPLPSAVMDYIAGENVVGEKATLTSVVSERMLPMTWTDIWDAEKELNIPQGTVASIEAFFGTGMSTYGPRRRYRDADQEGKDKILKSFLAKMEWDSAVPEYRGLLAPDQMKQVDERRKEVQGNLVFDVLSEPPDRKKAKSDESYQENLKRRKKTLDTFNEMKAEVPTFEEALELLNWRYTFEFRTAENPLVEDGKPIGQFKGSKYRQGYKERVAALEKLYGKE